MVMITDQTGNEAPSKQTEYDGEVLRITKLGNDFLITSATEPDCDVAVYVLFNPKADDGRQFGVKGSRYRFATPAGAFYESDQTSKGAFRIAAEKIAAWRAQNGEVSAITQDFFDSI